MRRFLSTLAVLGLPVLCAAWVWLPGGGQRPLDEVRLVNGRLVSGHVVQLDELGVSVAQGSKVERFASAQVSEIISPLTLLVELEARHALAAKSGDWRELMRWARQVGLGREARLAAVRVLARDWEQAEARELLEVHDRGAKSKLRLGSARLVAADLVRPLGDWERAIEWHSSFHSLESNAAPALAVDACFELERAYGRFFEQWAALLGAPLPKDLLAVELRARAADMPGLASGRGAYHDPERRLIVLCAEAGNLRQLLRHETSHQLLWAAWHASASSGPPPWLDEGLAERLSTTLEPNTTAGLSAYRYSQLEALQQQGELPDLEALLSANAEAFVGEESSLLYAAAHLFVEYLLEGENGALAPALGQWLRAAVAGTGETTPAALIAALGRPLDRLQAGWHTYLKAQLGR